MTCLAASFGASHGWTDHGFTECQPSSLRAIDTALQSDVQMLQTSAVPDSSRPHVSQQDQWLNNGGETTPRGDDHGECHDDPGRVHNHGFGLVVSVFANSGDYATTENVDGTSLAYVYIHVFFFPALPTTGALIIFDGITHAGSRRLPWVGRSLPRACYKFR